MMNAAIAKEYELLCTLSCALEDGNMAVFNHRICRYLRGFDVTRQLDTILYRVQGYVENGFMGAAKEALRNAREAWGARLQESMNYAAALLINRALWGLCETKPIGAAINAERPA